jgi:Flp pilus assembly protein TadG
MKMPEYNPNPVSAPVSRGHWLALLPKRFGRCRRGGLAVPLAFGLTAIMMAVGASVDYARVVRMREIMQAALDQATISAASDQTTAYAATGTAALKANLTANNVSQTTLTSGFSRDAAALVTTGNAGIDVPLTFAAILGKQSLTIAVSAKVTTPTTTSTTTDERVCILVKSATRSQALLVNSGATVTAPDCAIHVASQASPAAIFNGGSNISTAKICIKGNTIISNGGTHPNLQTGCTTASDPFAASMPTPPSGSCDWSISGSYDAASLTLNPGYYCGVNFNSAATVTLNPGLYIIDGNWNVNGGNFTGAGVTFYFKKGSSIQFNSGVKATLSAPTSGTYKNILIFQDNSSLGWTPSWVLDDSKGHQLQGLIYLPGYDVTLNSGANATADNLTMVVNTLILNSMTWALKPHDGTAFNGSGVVSSTTTSNGNMYLSH